MIGLLILAGAGLGYFLLSKPGATATKPQTISVKIPPSGSPQSVDVKIPSSTSLPSGQVQIPATPYTPPIKVDVPVPTSADYPAAPASGDTSPTLSQAEQYSLASYSNDQLYNDAMTSGHQLYVAAAAAKLAAAGDTRAMDLTLRVANWGK